jgi:muconolactone delta-isomerase
MLESTLADAALLDGNGITSCDGAWDRTSHGLITALYRTTGSYACSSITSVDELQEITDNSDTPLSLRW